MTKPATDLFELAEGGALPSDADLSEVDAPAKDRKRLEILTAEIDALCHRLKFLQPESRLTAARHLAKGVNSTTRMFNCAVFIRDKEEHETLGLFDAPVRNEAEEPELL